MDLRRVIPSDITASAIAHVSLLTLLLLFSEVHPFGTVTAEQIPVEIVTPQDILEQPKPAEQAVTETKPEPAPIPRPDPLVPDRTAAAGTPPPSGQLQPQPQRQAALVQPAAPPQSQPAAPSYKPPEPDVTIKYQVLLGLPPDLSPLPSATAPGRSRGDDDFDGPAIEGAKIASSLIAEFRRHLKTCSKLPASLSEADNVEVKLRVLMTPDGRLAAAPVPIEGKASMKALSLMQEAVRALQACQPYAMLPTDRYGEWKVLDLSFTPKDFSAS
ncbi:hypothetical protein [Bradyrhizobium paxllaeri]|uniref:hypothetical protein n=1 Tax=Bradyrhizobium paxllaeri TaxID=190148 RepID=UPI000810469C|nr:hypothetical protein [Bradyrhizobium paxllaeri]